MTSYHARLFFFLLLPSASFFNSASVPANVKSSPCTTFLKSVTESQNIAGAAETSLRPTLTHAAQSAVFSHWLHSSSSFDPHCCVFAASCISVCLLLHVHEHEFDPRSLLVVVWLCGLPRMRTRHAVPRAEASGRGDRDLVTCFIRLHAVGTLRRGQTLSGLGRWSLPLAKNQTRTSSNVSATYSMSSVHDFSTRGGCSGSSSSTRRSASSISTSRSLTYLSFRDERTV